MMSIDQPVAALFLCIAGGHLIGRLRIGPVQLGGICGTLFVALALGQLGITVSDDLKNTAFALFIFALGFTAGPQFFVNIRSGWRYGIFSLIEVITVLALVAVAVALFRFDAGTAAGLFAGSATESAVLGTAAEAISGLGISDVEAARLEANLVTAYSVTYIFGLVAIVVFVTQIAPLLLKIDLQEEARKLGKKLGSDDDDAHEPGLPSLVGRAFRAGPVAGSTVGSFENSRRNVVTIERLKRGPDIIVAKRDTMIEADDILFVLGRRNAIISAQDKLGDELPVPSDANVPMTSINVVLVLKEAFGLTVSQLRKAADRDLRRGVFISKIQRLDHSIPVLPGTKLQQGDVLTLYGTEAAVTAASAKLGHTLPPTDQADFIFLGVGIVTGLLIGSLSYRAGAFDITLGAGGGALVAGLVFGWLHIHFPSHGTIPVPAAEFMKDFGLATFIAAIGLSAGPDAIRLVAEYGLLLPVLGVLVSAIPAAVSLFVGWKIMRIEAPILLGAIAGQHCSTPTITALVSQSKSSIPVIGYTVTYAISNVLLPLMGPVVVGTATALQ
jgi:aspartate-alanine antiporter